MQLVTDGSWAYALGSLAPLALLALIPALIYRRRSVRQRPGQWVLVWMGSMAAIFIFVAGGGVHN